MALIIGRTFKNGKNMKKYLRWDFFSSVSISFFKRTLASENSLRRKAKSLAFYLIAPSGQYGRLRLQVPSFQGHMKNKRLESFDWVFLIFHGARDGTFSSECRTGPCGLGYSFLRTPCLKCQIVGILPNCRKRTIRKATASSPIFIRTQKNNPSSLRKRAYIFLVPEMGLEPTHLSAYAPQAYVSTIPPPGRV